MASDKLHLSKNGIPSLYIWRHGVSCLFSTLVYRTVRKHQPNTQFQPDKILYPTDLHSLYFYINYLWLIDKVLFRKKTYDSFSIIYYW